MASLKLYLLGPPHLSLDEHTVSIGRQKALALLFYLVFTPVGIILRIARKDFLDRELEPQARSYWIKRKKAEFDKENYKKQF